MIPSTSIRWTARLRSISDGRIGPSELPERVVERLGRQVRVQPNERLAESPLQDDIAVRGVGALAGELADGDVRAVLHGVAGAGKPGKRRFLDSALGELTCHVARISARNLDGCFAQP